MSRKSSKKEKERKRKRHSGKCAITKKFESTIPVYCTFTLLDKDGNQIPVSKEEIEKMIDKNKKPEIIAVNGPFYVYNCTNVIERLNNEYGKE